MLNAFSDPLCLKLCRHNWWFLVSHLYFNASQNTLRYQSLSLGTLVPNSRDRHEKQWRPDFTRHKTHPKIRFV